MLAGICTDLIWRSFFALMTALLIILVIAPGCIRRLQRYKLGQVVRDDGPQSHLSKTGTPTMGGVLILFAVLVSCLLWGNWHSQYLWLALTVMLGFGCIGLVDDARKLIFKNPKGLAARWKYFWQSVIGLVAAIVVVVMLHEQILWVPFLKGVGINLGLGAILLAYFAIVGSSNAVNLTDGLDGLAALCVVIVAGAFAVIAVAGQQAEWAVYFGLPYLPGGREITVFCLAIVGAGIGFLWFNIYPARVFMGDVGSLALGAALGVVAVLLQQELLLIIMGGIFVAETISVILQVGYFKYSGGKRIFLMAPLHHHFEKKGWPETQVMLRFSLITLVLVFIGLAGVFLRG
ncbi:Phospho-N-acetylmuramoyl-pentapeptide-transferase [Piscirickettsia salmonis]|uniref:phospho-N-acetylmuramoyl-pentapeptide- transferase n=1 Tax=Piscirickettsia salmonis TaxID=1238 RepID=UPI0012B9321F|nr:phospho-N-acetylmuramoyl-pentapeptide-transferase [Piscirickettsia salmonis]QGP48617.1 Phospho-N-acetylmuramoyl-pentapeptide-transferase [Piscirickettsia salmonis]